MDPERARRSLVAELQERRLLRDPRIAQAFLDTPRHLFLPPEEQEASYLDTAYPIGEGQTISAPHMVAMMVEALDPKPGQRILEIGGGSGYHAAILARLVEPEGEVVSVELLPRLAERARAALARLPEPPAVRIVTGDGSLGWPDAAPFDGISVACAAPSVPPPLVEQLSPGGTLVIPVGSRSLQDLLRVRRVEDGTTTEHLGPCLFVPLVGRHGFAPGAG